MWRAPDGLPELPDAKVPSVFRPVFRVMVRSSHALKIEFRPADKTDKTDKTLPIGIITLVAPG